MIDLSLDTAVGDIAGSLPGAVEVFRQSGISYCCGGTESLRLAAEKAGYAPDLILGALQALVPAETAAPQETAALIDHITARYHDTHRAELEWLVPLAEKVERVHGDHEEAPLGLAEVLAALRDDLEGHMMKEEQVLFPMMRQGGHPMIVHPIAMMRQEHDEANALVDRVTLLTHDLTLPEGACRSWTALYTGLDKFARDLQAHVALENDVLFPRFEAA